MSQQTTIEKADIFKSSLKKVLKELRDNARALRLAADNFAIVLTDLDNCGTICKISVKATKMRLTFSQSDEEKFVIEEDDDSQVTLEDVEVDEESVVESDAEPVIESDGEGEKLEKEIEEEPLGESQLEEEKIENDEIELEME